MSTVAVDILKIEIAALKRVARGQSNVEAAHEEGVDAKTQAARVEEACVKLGAGNPTQAVILGIARGLFTLEELISKAECTFVRLTPREIDVLRLWSRGLKEEEIAYQLCMTRTNTLNRLGSARRKMRAGNSNDAAVTMAKKLSYF
jgi:DNA-binding NarL/FixJ family response regulator